MKILFGIATIFVALQGSLFAQTATVALQPSRTTTQPSEDSSDLHLLGGYQFAAGNSAAPRGRYFFEVSGEAQLKGKLNTWGFARINAMPQQVTSSVTEFVTNLATNVGNVKVNELGHSAEFLWGLKLDTGRLSPIVGIGIITPLDPQQNVDIFKATLTDASGNSIPEPQLAKLYPQIAGKDYVAFVPQSRDRSLWQYEAGASFRTTRKDAWLDLTIGQNEAVTAGVLTHAILRSEAYWKLTSWGVNHQRGPDIYLMLSGLYKIGKAHSENPLILTPSSGITVPGADVATVPSPASNRDIVRVGIAIDFGCTIRKCQ